MVLDIKRKLEEMTLEDFQGNPRASLFIPRHSDIKRIADYMKLITRPRVLDAGCGNGFITMLLAKEGVNIRGVNSKLDPNSYLFEIEGKFHIDEGNVEDRKWYKDKNIIFNSWMPSFIDWSGCFKYTKPRQDIIVYVKSRSTGMQPGMHGNYNDWSTYTPHNLFTEIDRWKCFGNDDFIDEKTPKLKTQVGEVIIQVRNDVYDFRSRKFSDIKNSVTDAQPYNWEVEMPKI